MLSQQMTSVHVRTDAPDWAALKRQVRAIVNSNAGHAGQSLITLTIEIDNSLDDRADSASPLEDSRASGLTPPSPAEMEEQALELLWARILQFTRSCFQFMGLMDYCNRKGVRVVFLSGMPRETIACRTLVSTEVI